MYQIWVKQLVSKTYFNKQCNTVSSPYCKLGEEGKKIWVGFCIATKDSEIPEKKKDKLQSLSLDEMRQVDNYRRANHVRPFPLETKKEKEAREGRELKSNDE